MHACAGPEQTLRNRSHARTETRVAKSAPLSAITCKQAPKQHASAPTCHNCGNATTPPYTRTRSYEPHCQSRCFQQKLEVPWLPQSASFSHRPHALRGASCVHTPLPPLVHCGSLLARHVHPGPWLPQSASFAHGPHAFTAATTVHVPVFVVGGGVGFGPHGCMGTDRSGTCAH